MHRGITGSAAEPLHSLQELTDKSCLSSWDGNTCVMNPKLLSGMSAVTAGGEGRLLTLLAMERVHWNTGTGYYHPFFFF